MKPYFSGFAKVEFIDKEDDGLPIFELTEELTFTYGKEGKSITVPKGFKGNGASFPRFYRAIMSPVDPRVLRASIIHDFIYFGGVPEISRFKADCIYYVGCRVSGLSKKTSAIQWALLRLCGRSHWWKNMNMEKC